MSDFHEIESAYRSITQKSACVDEYRSIRTILPDNTRDINKSQLYINLPLKFDAPNQ